MVTRQAAYRFATSCTILTLICGGVLMAFDGFPARWPQSAVKNELAKWDHASRETTTLDDVREGRLLSLGSPVLGVSPELLLWGDSHGLSAVSAMDALCKELGVTGVAACFAGTAPLLNVKFARKGELGENGPALSSAVVNYVKRHAVKKVVLAARWSFYQEKNPRLLEQAIPATILALREAGSKVWVLQDVPDVDVAAPKALAIEAIFGGYIHSWRRLPFEHQRENSIIYQLSGLGVPATFLDPAPQLLFPGSDRYRAEIDGISIYYDDNHLTQSASRALLLPLLRTAISN